MQKKILQDRGMYNQTDDKNDKKNELNLLEFVQKTRTIIISEEIDQKLAGRVCSQLLYLQELSDDPIKVILNTQGGHVEAGDTIHDMLKFVRPEIIMIGTGWVASAGIIIYLAADKKNRYSLSNTRYLIHQPWGGVQGPASDIEIEAREMEKMKKRLNTLIADATGQPFEKVEKDADRNFWLDAKEAIDYGIVKSIITNVKEIN